MCCIDSTVLRKCKTKEQTPLIGAGRIDDVLYYVYAWHPDDWRSFTDLAQDLNAACLSWAAFMASIIEERIVCVLRGCAMIIGSCLQRRVHCHTHMCVDDVDVFFGGCEKFWKMSRIFFCLEFCIFRRKSSRVSFGWRFGWDVEMLSWVGDMCQAEEVEKIDN